ncbi:hypothetical protein A9P93_14875 [Klebsiella pneumoniae]|nr:hypothetical protein A9P93_14875 [Klebsiella pneumoniae]GKN51008.1 hypothetical protein NUBL17188_19440 [Klebsiella pneumoniae]
MSEKKFAFLNAAEFNFYQGALRFWDLRRINPISFQTNLNSRIWSTIRYERDFANTHWIKLFESIKPFT